MMIKFILTLALCLLGLTGTIFAASDIRLIPDAFTVQGVNLPSGNYVLRPLSVSGDTPLFLLYSHDGRDHKATIQVRQSFDGRITAPELLFDRVNGNLELTAIRLEGRSLQVLK